MRPDQSVYSSQIAQAQEVLERPCVFIRALTNLADRQIVVASEDIFARGGIKLISRGTRLSGHFYERLTAHKLLKPLEHSVDVADAPDARQVIALAHEAAQRIPSLQPLLGEAMLERLDTLLSGVEIPKELGAKIVVMKETRPRLFRHSLLAASIAMVLGIRAKLPQPELYALALAALFHDIGELYIDPDFFAAENRMTMDQRRHVYTHPVTGYLVLRNFAELPEATAYAVLQHHERLDGTGYPCRLRGQSISRVARLLSVAEVAASLVEHQGPDRRIGIKFRMNTQKFDAQAVSLISGVFDAIDSPPPEGFDEHELVDRLSSVGQLFTGWRAFIDTCHPDELAAITPVVERVDSLRMMVLEPGFDQCRLEDIINIVGEPDSQLRDELSVLLEELDWHFAALRRGVERDQRVWGLKIPATIRPAFDGWLQQVYAFIDRGR